MLSEIVFTYLTNGSLSNKNKHYLITSGTTGRGASVWHGIYRLAGRMAAGGLRLSRGPVFRNLKGFRMKAGIVASLLCREFQYTVIGIGDAARVVHGVAGLPDHFFAGGILQYLHGADQHNAPEKTFVVKIDTGLWILAVLGHPHGGGIGGKPELPDSDAPAGSEHGLQIGEAVLGNGGDKGNLLLVNQVSDCFFRISHHVTFLLFKLFHPL